MARRHYLSLVTGPSTTATLRTLGTVRASAQPPPFRQCVAAHRPGRGKPCHCSGLIASSCWFPPDHEDPEPRHCRASPAKAIEAPTRPALKNAAIRVAIQKVRRKPVDRSHRRPAGATAMVRVTSYGGIEVASAKSDPDPRVCGHERRWRALSTRRRPGSSRRRSSSGHRGGQGEHQTKPPARSSTPESASAMRSIGRP